MSARGADRRGSLRRLYGASPFHLLALLGCLALTAYAVSRLWGNPSLLRIAVWFVGAAIVWDLVIGPLLALADRGLRLRWSGLRRSHAQGPGSRRVPVLNYLRLPALLSGVLFAVWAPVILQRSEQIFQLKAGLSQDPYLERWLVITALLFAGSAVLYLLRVRRVGPRDPETT